MKRLSALLLCLALLLSVFGALADPTETTVAEIEKYGNLRLTVPGSEFLNAGFAYGDLVRVRVTDGIYKGAEGIVKRIKRDRKLLVAVEGVAVVAISNIPMACLEKIDTSLPG